ncbi:uncharacterized protein LOC131331456 [Rhododendron vialii]|uniref:uncharacterized protein LOC131331456 n=1 Tax=Rhododendron vialii TaxID=182163 RepID=UPI00265E751E|nr:uncharacterized protein LOC131331456 [Rhododendron vialii]
MRKAEEGLGASNGAEGHPGDILLAVDALLASSSAPRDQDSAYALPSASDELSAGGTVSHPQPITATNVSRRAAPAAPSTSLLPTRSGEALSIEIPSEGPRDRNDDNQGPFKLAKTFLGLTFQAALGLMIYRVTPQQGDSSTNLSPQGDSSANRSSLSAIQLNTVGATTLFSFASTMSGMMLKNHNRKAANFCSYAGVFLGALGFFLMVSIFAEESLDWLVWAVGGFLLLVFAYTIRREMGI